MSSHHRPILLTLFPFFALTVVLGLRSDGVHHDDDLTHFLMARWSSSYPSYLLHIWGRPGLTIPLSAVAWIGDREAGWHAARFLSAIVTAASAWIAARLAQQLGIRPPWLVVAICYLQPLAMVLGFTTLTENFAALYLVGAIALLNRRRIFLASAVFSLILVTRHETIIFLPLWWIAVFLMPIDSKRRVGAISFSLWAPIAHNLAYFAVFREWPMRIFSQASGSTQYPAQGIWSYLPDALYAIPPAIAGLAAMGAAVMLHRRQLLIPAAVALFFFTQVAVKALGVFASGGYGRFMVVVAPLVAILAVAGIADVADRLRTRRPVGTATCLFASVWIAGWIAIEEQRIAGRLTWPPQSFWYLRGTLCAILTILFAHWLVTRSGRGQLYSRITAAILLITCIVQAAIIVRPLQLRPTQTVVREAAAWICQHGFADSPFFGTDPWFAYFFDLAEHPRAHKGTRLLATMPVGTIFVWDSLYSESDFHRLKAATYDMDPHYELLTVFRIKDKSSVELRVYRKISATPLPTTQETYYPPVPTDQAPIEGIYYLRKSR